SSLRFGPDAAALAFDDLLADSQDDAGSRVFLLDVQALEDDEDPRGVLGIEADAVVADGEDPLVAFAPGRDMDEGRGLAAELDRVADQILEDLPESNRVGPECRQGVVRDDGSRLLDRLLQIQ